MIGEVYRRAFAACVVELVSCDREVRSTDDAEPVHDARVALRRLRSYLRTFRPILDRQWADALRDRMRWLNEHLANARDLDVLVATLEARASPDLMERLRGQRAQHHADVRQALKEPRYLALIEDIVAAARDPRLNEVAAAPARKSARKLLRKVWRRAYRRVRAYNESPGEPALHQVRIKAKHLRYAAECFEPLHGKRAKKLARRAERLQAVLGDHRDAVAATNIVLAHASNSEVAPPPRPDWRSLWKKMERAYARLR